MNPSPGKSQSFLREKGDNSIRQIPDICNADTEVAWAGSSM